MKPEKLQQHPEGGRFAEVFRSNVQITTQSGGSKQALTHIYFQLAQGEVSKWHKVSSDEVWNLYQGELRLHIWDGSENNAPYSIELSKANNEFCHVVPAYSWQAAEPVSNSALVGCSVAPGFEFEDFELIDPNSKTAQTITAFSKDMIRFI